MNSINFRSIITIGILLFAIAGCSIFQKNNHQSITNSPKVLSKRDSLILGYWYIGFDKIVEEYDGLTLLRKKPISYYTLHIYKFNANNTYTFYKSSDDSEIKSGSWEIRDNYLKLSFDNNPSYIKIYNLNRLDSVLSCSYFSVYRNDQALPCDVYSRPISKSQYLPENKYKYSDLTLNQKNDSLLLLGLKSNLKYLENKFCEFTITINCEGSLGQVSKSYYRNFQGCNMADSITQKLTHNLCQLKFEPCKEYNEVLKIYEPIDMSAKVVIKCVGQKLIMEFKN